MSELKRSQKGFLIKWSDPPFSYIGVVGTLQAPLEKLVIPERPEIDIKFSPVITEAKKSKKNFLSSDASVHGIIFRAHESLAIMHTHSVDEMRASDILNYLIGATEFTAEMFPSTHLLRILERAAFETHDQYKGIPSPRDYVRAVRGKNYYQFLVDCNVSTEEAMKLTNKRFNLYQE